MNYSKQFDKILDVADAIPMDGSISLLTGRNASGKSLVRKYLAAYAKQKFKKNVVHSSMQLRTGSHAELGAMGGVFADREYSSTSAHTLYLIQTASRSLHGGYLCLDEIEVGMGEETILGIVDWVNANIGEAIKDALGCLVITHSRLVVQNLKFDHWFSLDGYETPQAWLDRKVVPTDLEELSKNDHGFFLYVHKLSTKGDKK